MNELMLRRRKALQNINLPYFGYVSDGLFMLLDGIDKGTTEAGKWVDLVNGYVFTQNGTVTFNSDNIELPGTTDNFLSNGNTLPIPLAAEGTIEVVYQTELTSGVIFSPPSGKASLGLILGNNRYLIGIWQATASMYQLLQYYGKVSVSLSDAIGFSNGTNLQQLEKGNANTGYWNTYIGRNTNGYYFKGKVYCIRIYNRQLTTSEILSNFTIDLNRFNIYHPSEYVSNGLVLHLDGIDKGNIENVWVDKVSGYQFTNHGAAFNTNHVYFDGSSYLDCNTFHTPLASEGTIELVYKFDGTGYTRALIYMPEAGQQSLAFGVYDGKAIWVSSSSSNCYASTKLGYDSYSADGAYRNGMDLSVYSTDYWTGANNSNCFIGCRGGGQNFFIGKLYSIRIYNRKLTKDEVRTNNLVDIQRFGAI